MIVLPLPRPPVRNVLGQTLDQLGESIVSGHHAVGSSLPPEPLLCSQFGVSRTVIREAVKSLVAKGLLITGPKLGTRVLPESQWNWFDPQVVAWQSRVGLTRDFLRDLKELRRVVEPAAVRLAAERATPADIIELEDAFAGMKQAIDEGGDYVSHDLRFHQALLRASHNRMLGLMSKALDALLRTSFELSTSAGAAALSLPLHRAILDAVIAHSPSQAEGACHQLIDNAAAEIDKMLGSRRKLPSVITRAKPLPAPVNRTAHRRTKTL